MKKVIYLITLLVLGIFLYGCAKESSEGDYKINYLSSDESSIVEKDYDTRTVDTDELINELLELMRNDQGEIDYINPIPTDVEVIGFTLNDEQLLIDFSNDYLQMDKAREVLCRAAVVQTLCQVEGISYISFSIEGQPLEDALGNVVGYMTQDDFATNPSDDINSIQQYNLTLYYADSTGQKLVETTRNVYVSSDVSVEKVAIQSLLETPEDSSLQKTIPDDVKLLGVSLIDGICIVNFSSAFLNQNYNISEDVIIYSIVDTLTSLVDINEVQISVEGSSDMILRKDYSLDNLYERNLDLVISSDEYISSQETEDEFNSDN